MSERQKRMKRTKPRCTAWASLTSAFATTEHSTAQPTQYRKTRWRVKINNFIVKCLAARLSRTEDSFFRLSVSVAIKAKQTRDRNFLFPFAFLEGFKTSSRLDLVNSFVSALTFMPAACSPSALHSLSAIIHATLKVVHCARCLLIIKIKGEKLRFESGFFGENKLEMNQRSSLARLRVMSVGKTLRGKQVN